MTSNGPAVILEKKDGIAHITLNRPERRNALSKEVRDGLTSVLDGLRNDDSIRVVTTTGAGDVAYCAGMDVRELKERHEHPESGGEEQHLSLFVRQFPKVTIAIVNGYALGAGLSLMNCHDLAIASENAKFGLPEIMRSFVPRGAVVPLFRQTHMKWAFEILLSGKNFDAQRAYQAGLINRVVPHARLQEAAQEWAKEIARWDPLTLMYCKKAAYSSVDASTYLQALELVSLWQGEEARKNPRSSEGLRDFIAGKGVKANM
ncbi:MAG: enoyl-CoA hydratase/isomerase family protein [Chloroflexi bacterium]|nr:enoyl-CoA hydratase/isomerase family protein [Chloroflexota bacterium]